MRLFGAVEDERVRIARDLHDDQAQLLAAARLALEGGRDEARAIFERLEGELRVRSASCARLNWASARSARRCAPSSTALPRVG